VLLVRINYTVIGQNVAKLEDVKRTVYKLVCVLSWRYLKGPFINSVCAELEVLKRAVYKPVWCSHKYIVYILHCTGSLLYLKTIRC